MRRASSSSSGSSASVARANHNTVCIQHDFLLIPVLLKNMSRIPVFSSVSGTNRLQNSPAGLAIHFPAGYFRKNSREPVAGHESYAYISHAVFMAARTASRTADRRFRRFHRRLSVLPEPAAGSGPLPAERPFAARFRPAPVVSGGGRCCCPPSPGGAAISGSPSPA